MQAQGAPTNIIICLLFPFKNSRVYRRLLGLSKEVGRGNDRDELSHSKLSLRVALGTTSYRDLPGE